MMDMAGNVSEWCLNRFYNPNKANLSGTTDRALRGGSCVNRGKYARCANRSGGDPSIRIFFIGFRVVVARPTSP
jgi:formylglycine-generating enzyme required for sulfatase activity